MHNTEKQLNSLNFSFEITPKQDIKFLIPDQVFKNVTPFEDSNQKIFRTQSVPIEKFLIEEKQELDRKLQKSKERERRRDLDLSGEIELLTYNEYIANAR